MAEQADKLTRIKELEIQLAEYEKAIHLPVVKSENDLDTYLNYDTGMLKRLSPEDCDEVAYKIGCYAFFLQKEHNKYVAWCNWAESNIDVITAPILNNYQAYGYKEKRLMALKGHEFAIKLEEFRVASALKADRLGFLANRLEYIGNVVIGARYTKQKARQ